MGMTIDFSDFEKGFKLIAENVAPEEVAKGLFEAGNELLHDAITIRPQAPKDIGDLWDSRTVKIAKSEKGEIEVDAGFNIAYAARWHELSIEEDEKIKWTRTKGATYPGRKYLESKMVILKDKYMGKVADFLKRVLR